MTALSKRARFEETAFANHRTEEFLARANSLRKLGEWAASQMMDDQSPAIAKYADALVRSGSIDPNAIRGVADSLSLHGCTVDETVVVGKFEEFLHAARTERGV
ncbi:MAG: hypothetical protein CME88_07245 [Hirschia sp.]|nr:hypothetical protein [Hirschia sp.]MBF18157.1 hypothetical protein [Hirschia sp.]|tara:strand:- start:67 stop:378 length:312 start_codon:yes stop_codon:yes gene_type:complete